MPSEGLAAEDNAKWKPSAILAGIRDAEKEGGASDASLSSSRDEALAMIRQKAADTFRRMDLSGEMKRDLADIVGAFAKAAHSAKSETEIGSAKDDALARIQGIYDERLRMIEDF